MEYDFLPAATIVVFVILLVFVVFVRRRQR